MAVPRALRVLVLLALVPALAGCSFPDWYKQRGTVYVDLAPLAATDTAINEFQSLKVQVFGVSLKKLGVVEPYEFTFGQPALVVDLVKEARAGAKVPMVVNKTNLRAFESVTVRLDVVEAVTASGATIPGCHPGQPVASRPCVSTPTNGAYRIERQFSPPRGGEIRFEFPLLVHFNAAVNEYYIATDPERVDFVVDE